VGESFVMQPFPPPLVIASRYVGWLLQEMKSLLLNPRSNLPALGSLQNQSRKIDSSLVINKFVLNCIDLLFNALTLLAMTKEGVKVVSSILYAKNLRMNYVDCKLSRRDVVKKTRLPYV
jgi:hypothetical protein